MTFSFVVEIGDADPDANSYASTDYADDYISTNPFASAAWLALETLNKQYLLVRSSKYLDQMVAWNGDRVDDESGLRWPRSGVYDEDGFEIQPNVIPDILQDAVCEVASLLANGTDWTQPQDGRGIKEVQADSVRIQWDTMVSIRASLPDFVIQMLGPLGVVNRGTRPAFKPIVRM